MLLIIRPKLISFIITVVIVEFNDISDEKNSNRFGYGNRSRSPENVINCSAIIHNIKHNYLQTHRQTDRQTNKDVDVKVLWRKHITTRIMAPQPTLV